jgi:hypothetical protein
LKSFSSRNKTGIKKDGKELQASEVVWEDEVEARGYALMREHPRERIKGSKKKALISVPTNRVRNRETRFNPPSKATPKYVYQAPRVNATGTEKKKHSQRWNSGCRLCRKKFQHGKNELINHHTVNTAHNILPSPQLAPN